MNNFNPQNKQIVFNPNQFAQMVPNLTNNMLQQLVQQALSQGIPQAQIDEGLKYIASLR